MYPLQRRKVVQGVRYILCAPVGGYSSYGLKRDYRGARGVKLVFGRVRG
jgi:hypothetical protein